jgi:hypothetical protein
MSNRTAQPTPPVAPPRHKLALVTSAGAYGVMTLVVGDTTGDRSAPRPAPSTCAPGSWSWAHAGRAAIIAAHDRVQG